MKAYTPPTRTKIFKGDFTMFNIDRIFQRLQQNLDLSDFEDWTVEELTDWIAGYLRIDSNTAGQVAKRIKGA